MDNLSTPKTTNKKVSKGKKAAGPEHLKNENLKSVLHSIANSPEPLSRADIAQSTGITKATVSRLVDELISAHIVHELSPSKVVNRGRPSVPLILNSNTHIGIGIEINIGYIAIEGLDLAGNIIFRIHEECNLKNSNHEVVFKRINKILASIPSGPSGNNKIVGITLAIPGLVDSNRGIILRAPNLNWNEVNPAEYLELPKNSGHFKVINESNAAALSFTFKKPGVPNTHPNFIYIYGDHGVGGAIVRNYQLLSGIHGWAGEIGHMCIEPEGPECSCGSRGCLEQYLGLMALKNNSEITGYINNADALLELRSNPDYKDKIDTALHLAATKLGISLSSLINLLDIDTIVFGGHLAMIFEHIKEQTMHTIKQRLISTRWCTPKILKADSDRSAAITGGAYIALQNVFEHTENYLPTSE